MKRISRLALLGLLCALLLVPAFAAETTTWRVMDLFTIEIPSELAVFTRNTPEYSPNLIKWGLTKSALLSQLEEHNTYLLGLIGDPNGDFYEFDICIVSGMEGDFNELSDAQMDMLLSDLQNECEQSGATWQSAKIVSHDQVKFIDVFTSRTVEGNELFMQDFVTLHDDRVIYIKLTSYAGEIGSKWTKMLEEMAASVRFLEEQAPPEAAAPASNESESVAPAPEPIAPKSGRSASNPWTVWNFLTADMVLGLLVAAFAYSLPIFLVRYGILKAPLARKKALLLALLYGGVVFLSIGSILFALDWSVLLPGVGIAILAWSAANFGILFLGERPAAAFQAEEWQKKQAAVRARTAQPNAELERAFLSGFPADSKPSSLPARTVTPRSAIQPEALPPQTSVPEPAPRPPRTAAPQSAPRPTRTAAPQSAPRPPRAPAPEPEPRPPRAAMPESASRPARAPDASPASRPLPKQPKADPSDPFDAWFEELKRSMTDTGAEVGRSTAQPRHAAKPEPSPTRSRQAGSGTARAGQAFDAAERPARRQSSIPAADWPEAGRPAESPAPAGARPRQAAKFCRMCGAKLAPGSRFCDQCGVRIGRGGSE